MEGITHPIICKSSPNKTEIAILSKYNHGEKTLTNLYSLDGRSSSKHSPPTVPEFCILASKIVLILEQIHLKKVRHGNLRPDVISCWREGDDMKVCIRDFSESALVGDSESPAGASPASDDMLPNISPDRACIFYLAPETISGTIQPGLTSPIETCCAVRCG